MCFPCQVYLEAKRVAFPRLYFISDSELLDILTKARNPLGIQVHNKYSYQTKGLKYLKLSL